MATAVVDADRLAHEELAAREVAVVLAADVEDLGARGDLLGGDDRIVGQDDVAIQEHQADVVLIRIDRATIVRPVVGHGVGRSCRLPPCVGGHDVPAAIGHHAMAGGEHDPGRDDRSRAGRGMPAVLLHVDQHGDRVVRRLRAANDRLGHGVVRTAVIIRPTYPFVAGLGSWSLDRARSEPGRGHHHQRKQRTLAAHGLLLHASHHDRDRRASRRVATCFAVTEPLVFLRSSPCGTSGRLDLQARGQSDSVRQTGQNMIQNRAKTGSSVDFYRLWSIKMADRPVEERSTW